MHKSVCENSERTVTPSQKRPFVERLAKPDIEPRAAEVRFVRTGDLGFSPHRQRVDYLVQGRLDQGQVMGNYPARFELRRM